MKDSINILLPMQERCEVFMMVKIHSSWLLLGCDAM